MGKGMLEVFLIKFHTNPPTRGELEKETNSSWGGLCVVVVLFVCLLFLSVCLCLFFNIFIYF